MLHAKRLIAWLAAATLLLAALSLAQGVAQQLAAPPQAVAALVGEMKLGTAAYGTRDFRSALAPFQKALATAEQITDPRIQSGLPRMLDAIGECHRALGENAESIPYYQRSLALREKAFDVDHAEVADSLNGITGAYTAPREYARALQPARRALDVLTRALGAEHPDLAVNLNYLGQVYFELGEFAQAIPLVERSLPLAEKAYGPDHHEVGKTVGNLASLYLRQCEYAKALPLFQRALAISEKTAGPNHPEIAGLMASNALLHENMEEYAQALPLRLRSHAILEKALGPSHWRIASSLISIANAQHIALYSKADPAAVITALMRTQAIAAAANAPVPLLMAHVSLLAVHFRMKQPDIAIFHGKQAVNNIKAMRERLTDLDPASQRAFLRNKAAVYHALADLLIQQEQLAEAQHVTGMQKEEEFFDFIRRSEESDPRSRRITFLSHEEQWRERLAALLARGTVPEAEIVRYYCKLTQGFAAQKGKATDTADAAAQLRATQQMLVELGAGVVLAQYLVSDNRLNILLTTATGQSAQQIDISAADINRKVEFFRAVLQNPSVSALALAQERHNLLVASIADELAKNGARTLMLSLDGSLRYVPFGAPQDGSQFLVEKYGLAHYTEVAREGLRARAGERRSIAGLCLTRQIEDFAPLPATRTELQSIVRTGNAGLIPGEAHFDEQFTATSMHAALGKRHPHVHIASHFVFRSGNEATSFLLLGDGDRLTLSRICQEKLDFSHVDLVTLSACETGVVGGRTAQGEEVEGPGALLQKQSAKGVIATLWPVADDSTGLLMQNFYKLRKEKKRSKADALRQAQLLLVNGRTATGTPGTNTARRDLDAPLLHRQRQLQRTHMLIS